MDITDSGIHLLPNELLIAFFDHCVPYPTRDRPGPRVSRNHPAVVLSHVCRDWRELTLSTPRLWSRLYIETPPSDSFTDATAQEWSRLLDKLQNTVRAWIERSAECQLTIFLDVGAFDFNPPALADACESHESVVKEVLRCSKRWHTIGINFGSVRALRSFLAVSLGRAIELPILTSFDICITPGGAP